MVLAGEFDHEHRADAGDRPADTDVGATVHLAHDPFEDPGGELWASLFAEDQPAGAGVGGEGERVRRRVARVGERVVGAECFGGVDQGGLGGDRGVQVAGGVRVGEKLMQMSLPLVGEVGSKTVEVSGHRACLAFQVERAALDRGVGPEDLDAEVGDRFLPVDDHQPGADPGEELGHRRPWLPEGGSEQACLHDCPAAVASPCDEADR